MTQSNLKDELLKQNGHTALDQEVSNLRRLVEAEQRRARRLTIWTISVWILWILMLALGLGLPYVQARSNGPHVTSTTQPIQDTPTAAQLQQQQQRVNHSGGGSALAAAVGVMLLAVFLVMPFAGIVLTIMMILARRSASFGQIRASLASIDVQLRLALAAQQPPPNRNG